jgi:hypothetical protein
VITTYSLGLATLLTLPVHLLLSDPSSRSQLLENPVAMLDALRRARDKLTVFCEQGRMKVPARQHVLFSLLEPVVHEVFSKRGGAFHPKVWVLKFRPVEKEGPILMRALVLSRNLTDDRSWDLALRLDGQLTHQRQAQSWPLRRLLHWLEDRPRVSKAHRARVHRMALEVGRTQWEVPAPFQSVAFTVLGLDADGWMPTWERRADQLVVISPFIDEEALIALSKTAVKISAPGSDASAKQRGPVGLVSRPEQLARIDPAVLRRFAGVYTLKEQVESEDGEDMDPALTEVHGLHAKAYLSWKGWRMRMCVGSPNATSRALVRGQNIEFLAELEGLASHWGRAENFLSGDDGIADLLEPWPIEDAAVPEEDTAANAVRKALEDARNRLVRVPIQAHCVATAEGFVLELQPESPVEMTGVDGCRLWPVTLSDERAQDAMAFAQGEAVRVGIEASALVTGLIAFELKATGVAHRERFVRNLEVTGLPDDRDGAIIEAILKGKDSFLTYLRYLLGTMASEDASSQMTGSQDGAWAFGLAALTDRALLEGLTRTLARDPKRLWLVQDVVNSLKKAGKTKQIIPEGFEAMWSVFEQLLPERDSAQKDPS